MRTRRGVPGKEDPVWTGKEVSYRHLKVFGCLACVHVAKDRRGMTASPVAVTEPADDEDPGYGAG